MGKTMNNFRSISKRIYGRQHGPITRLISPDDVGELLKPFIFLDYFNAEITPGFGFPMHPHSGIATLTWQPGCDVQYQDTTGKSGTLKAGGLEWMNAGGGAWHQGMLQGNGRVTGFQLWVPMPPAIEDGHSLGQYVPPDEVPVVPIVGGAVKVLLGSFESARSPITSHQDMNYFVVSLAPGQTWRYQPPIEHDIAFTFKFEGDGLIQGMPAEAELLVFEQGDGEIEISAAAVNITVLLGTAKKHPYPLILGTSSVHTNAQSLERSLEKIRQIGANLP
jgi:redox-sensitive bicupin YhaK (pirin superfamily)